MVAVLVAGLSPAAAQTGDPGVDQLAADYSEAWAQGGRRGCGESPHRGRDSYHRRGVGTVVGRAAIQREFAAIFSGSMATKLMVSVGRTTQLTDDISVNEGTFEIAGGETPARGSYLNTLVMQNGRWLIASAATIPPAPSGQ